MDIAEILGRIGFDAKMALFNIINFLIVLFIARKFFFDKLVKAINTKQEIIKSGLEDAERYKYELAMARQKGDDMISKAKNEANAIVIKAQKDAEELTTDLKQQAEAEITDREMKSQAKLELERKEMVSRLKKETADLAILATEKIINEKLDEKKDREIINKYLNELED